MYQYYLTKIQLTFLNRVYINGTSPNVAHSNATSRMVGLLLQISLRSSMMNLYMKDNGQSVRTWEMAFISKHNRPARTDPSPARPHVFIYDFYSPVCDPKSGGVGG